MDIINNEYSKLLEEKMQFNKIKFMFNKNIFKKEAEINMELFFIRLSLKKIILKLIGTNGIDVNNVFKELNFFSKHEEIELFKEFIVFFKKSSGLFPTFIFDDYNEINFKKCIEYKNFGHTISEIEEYYINQVKNKKGIIL